MHAHGTRAMSNVFASASKYRIPLMYTVHGWSFHPDQPFFIRKMREYSEWFLTSKDEKSLIGTIYLDELYDVGMNVAGRKIRFNCGE